MYLGIALIFEVGTATLDFSFETPIQAFGTYIIGLGTANGDLSIEFNDGTPRSISATGDAGGGVQFVGFTAPGASISRVTLTLRNVMGGSRDNYSVDGVRYTPAAALLPAAPLVSQIPVATTTEFARLAPYEDIVWPESTPGQPQVLLGSDWFQLTSVDGTAVAEIIAHARTAFGPIWQKRFDEDLVEVLGGMGSPPGESVVLGLRDPETGEALERAAPMNSENRAALMQAKSMRAGPLPVPAVRTRGDLSGEEIAADLNALQAEMEGRWAYLRATGVDYRSAIAALRERGAGGMTHTEFGLEVLKIISMFVDGHATVSGIDYPPGMLPFFIESAGDRFVAIQADRSAFLDPDHPYISHVDERPLEEWLSAAAPFVSKASPQWTRRRSLNLLQRLQFVRDLMGLPSTDRVKVALASEDGSETREVDLPVASAGPRRGPWPATRSAVIDGNVGYLRLASMNAAAVNEVATWMPQFRETRGLIVDVRGNGGGSRDALRALFPYVMSEGDAPRVVNTAQYRLHADYGVGHLGGSRFMYRESWDGWAPEERDAIARFRDTFEPQWMPPEEEFSDWHYLVMSRSMNPEAYVYGKPVIVLLDENSFSATDIFVSAFKGWHDVTLVGIPSGGGSARQVSVRLPASGLVTNLASMASFQWTGLLHDGNGTQPDVLVHPEAEYFLRGGRDNVLERALELL